MIVKHIHLNTIEEVKEKLFETYNHKNNFIFRGEGSEKYTLLPTSLRPQNMIKIHNAIRGEYKKEFTQVMCEFRLLQEFYVYAKNNNLDIPDCEHFNRSENPLDNRFWWEEEIEDFTIPHNLESLFALAQHYGTYTRLLDFSKDLNVGIYFGLTGAMYRMKNYSPKKIFNIQENFILWSIDVEKLSLLNKNSFPIILLENTYGTNENLKAQSGVFLYHKSKFYSPKLMEKFMAENSSYAAPLTDRTPFDEIFGSFKSDLEDVITKYTIPYNLVHQLYGLQYKKGNLAAKYFPGYMGVTKQIEENRLSRWTDYYIKNELSDKSIFNKWTDHISMEEVDLIYGANSQ